jgi:hypothetical protein
MYLNICKMHEPICKGHCCEKTTVFCDWAGPNLPAHIKKSLPMVNLIKPSLARTSDGKSHHGWAFSCNNFNEKTKLCKDFEHRPDMCRWFICEEAVEILSLVDGIIEPIGE